MKAGVNPAAGTTGDIVKIELEEPTVPTFPPIIHRRLLIRDVKIECKVKQM